MTLRPFHSTLLELYRTKIYRDTELRDMSDIFFSQTRVRLFNTGQFSQKTSSFLKILKNLTQPNPTSPNLTLRSCLLRLSFQIRFICKNVENSVNKDFLNFTGSRCRALRDFLKLYLGKLGPLEWEKILRPMNFNFFLLFWDTLINTMKI